jgi:hypothetical protein
MLEHLTSDNLKFGITLLFILFGLLIVSISGAFVANTYFESAPKDAPVETNKFLKSQSSLRLLTVLAVVSAVSILSLFGPLGEGVIAIFSGITGYVLGGIPAVNKTNENE